MKLSDLKMDELRALAFDLEVTLDRELSLSRKKKDAISQIEEALLELAGHNASSASDLLRSRGIDSHELLISTESDSELEKDEDKRLEPEAGEIADPEAYEAAKAAGVVEELEGHDFNPPLDGPLPHALQVREHPMNGRVHYGDLILSPTVDDLRYTHVALGKKGYEKLKAHGYRTVKG